MRSDFLSCILISIQHFFLIYHYISQSLFYVTGSSYTSTSECPGLIPGPTFLSMGSPESPGFIGIKYHRCAKSPPPIMMPHHKTADNIHKYTLMSNRVLKFKTETLILIPSSLNSSSPNFSHIRNHLSSTYETENLVSLILFLHFHLNPSANPRYFTCKTLSTYSSTLFLP